MSSHHFAKDCSSYIPRPKDIFTSLELINKVGKKQKRFWYKGIENTKFQISRGKNNTRAIKISYSKDIELWKKKKKRCKAQPLASHKKNESQITTFWKIYRCFKVINTPSIPSLQPGSNDVYKSYFFMFRNSWQQ